MTVCWKDKISNKTVGDTTKEDEELCHIGRMMDHQLMKTVMLGMIEGNDHVGDVHNDGLMTAWTGVVLLLIPRSYETGKPQSKMADHWP